MSQATHPAALSGSPLRVRRTAILLGSLAFVAAALVVLALTFGGSDACTVRSTVSHQPATRPDGGPDESAVAASVGSRAGTRPSESTIATASGAAASGTTARPDESRVAAAVSQTRRHPSTGPDESRVAASIAGR